MTDDGHPIKPLIDALNGVKNSRALIIQELRDMADATEPYRRFTYLSPWIKNIWRAAADMIEGDANKNSTDF